MNAEDDQHKIYQDVRRRISYCHAQRTEIVTHAVAFFVSMIIIWLLLLTLLPQTLLALVSAAWALGFTIHLVQHVMYELRERAIDAEATRLGLYATEKPKREDRLMRLGADGELIEHEAQQTFQDGR